jgi:hypothetical protein
MSSSTALAAATAFAAPGRNTKGSVMSPRRHINGYRLPASGNVGARWIREEWFFSLCRRHHLDGWELKFVDTPRLTRLGQCDNRKKLIILDVKIFDHKPEQILDTLLHEVAHALDPWMSRMLGVPDKTYTHREWQNAMKINEEMYGPMREVGDHRSVSTYRKWNRDHGNRTGHGFTWARIAIGLGCKLKYAQAGYDLEILRRARAEARKAA